MELCDTIIPKQNKRIFIREFNHLCKMMISSHLPIRRNGKKNSTWPLKAIVLMFNGVIYIFDLNLQKLFLFTIYHRMTLDKIKTKWKFCCFFFYSVLSRLMHECKIKITLFWQFDVFPFNFRYGKQNPNAYSCTVPFMRHAIIHQM